ncbi:MAG: response regulator transcription factor [Bacteroidota bacterium]
MSSINILIVDDHQMIRDGIRASLADIPDIKVVDEASNGVEALNKLEQCSTVQLVIMDIGLGSGQDGIATTQQIKEQYPEMTILALTMHNEEPHITSMLRAGAAGYLLKDTGMDELVTAIRTVANGQSYFSQEVSTTIMNRLMRNQKENNTSSAKVIESLTPREREVLQLIAEEYTNPEIADRLFISPRTVDTHRRNLILKLNVKNTAGLVRYAIKENLVDL